MKAKQIIAWVLYDLADTPVSALYITFFWPLYIKEHLGGNEFQIGLAMGLSLLFIALTVPILGALSDAWGRRMPILIVSTALTALTVALTGYVGLFVALVLGFFTRYLLTVDTDIYDVKLVDIAPKKKIGFVSGLGIGVGYVGTIAALAVAYPILNTLGWESLAAVRAMFWEGVAFLLVFSLPLFLLVKDPAKSPYGHRGIARQAPKALGEIIKKAFGEIRRTMAQMRGFGTLPRFLLASFVYNDAINTVLIFLVLYAREVIGVSIQQFFFAFAIMAAGSALGAFFFGRISDILGPKKALSIALVGWIFVVAYLLFSPTFRDLVIAGVIGGAMLGGVWTMNRHMITRITPYHKLGEIFGIEGFTERFSGVIGPIAFGALVVSFGYTPGLVLILSLLVVGFLLLQLVPRS
jgi:UMF1 family MFS transporter